MNENVAAAKAALAHLDIEDKRRRDQSEKPRLLLVFAGPEGPARPRHGRFRRQRPRNEAEVIEVLRSLLCP